MLKQDGDASAGLDGERLQTAISRQLSDLVVSSVIIALAKSEDIDLTSLRLPSAQRPRCGDELQGGNAPRLLDWSGNPSRGFSSPQAARKFFEEYELFPGLVVRGWDHQRGRLGFSLNGDRVTFELHVPSAGLLINGTPETVTIALRDVLPETVCMGLVGKPLERLVAWPPASGPDYLVVSVGAESGIQVVTLSTKSMTIALGQPRSSPTMERLDAAALS